MTGCAAVENCFVRRATAAFIRELANQHLGVDYRHSSGDARRMTGIC